MNTINISNKSLTYPKSVHFRQKEITPKAREKAHCILSKLTSKLNTERANSNPNQRKIEFLIKLQRGILKAFNQIKTSRRKVRI